MVHSWQIEEVICEIINALCLLIAKTLKNSPLRNERRIYMKPIVRTFGEMDVTFMKIHTRIHIWEPSIEDSLGSSSELVELKCKTLTVKSVKVGLSRSKDFLATNFEMQFWLSIFLVPSMGLRIWKHLFCFTASSL